MNTKKNIRYVNDYESFMSYIDSMALIISKMFGENCEVAISDLDNPSESVISIFNGHVSGRKKGDCLNARSEELIERSINGYNINYRKSNMKNKKEIKSSTIVVNAFGKNISFCINYDCDQMKSIQTKLKDFLEMSDNSYEEFSDEDNILVFETKIEEEIEKFKKPVSEFNKKDRIDFISTLKNMGIFNIRKSIPYIADRLGISRHTIYNYLKEIEE